VVSFLEGVPARSLFLSAPFASLSRNYLL
jgi:hypothetical protein